MKVLKSYLKKFPLFVSMNDRLKALRERRRAAKRDFSNRLLKIDLTRTFPLFVPNNSGQYEDIAKIVIESINQAVPLLEGMCKQRFKRSIDVQPIEASWTGLGPKEMLNELKAVLDRHGSDKATVHNYHFLYCEILKDRAAIRRILEIGLGTNNLDVVSNMGREGRPGASLRAFRDFCPSAQVYGADIDRRILFSEDRIQTSYVDQTDPASFTDLASQIGKDFDLVIDDGLHSADANIRTLQFGIMIVKKGGWVVIEDIPTAATQLWQLVGHLVPENFEPFLFRADGGMVFAVRRVS